MPRYLVELQILLKSPVVQPLIQTQNPLTSNQQAMQQPACQQQSINSGNQPFTLFSSQPHKPVNHASQKNHSKPLPALPSRSPDLLLSGQPLVNIKNEEQILKADEGEEAYETGNQFYKSCQYQKALSCFEASAAKQYPAACLRLYMIYRIDGYGVSIDPVKSDIWGQKVIEHIDWFKIQAEKGLADAQFNLGVCYANAGLGVTKNDMQAAKYYQLAADQGHVTAQFYLGNFYAHGSLPGHDYKQAVKYYQLAVDQGHADAQFILGGCYENRRGVTKDKKIAAYYYQLAASQKNKDAQNKFSSGEMKKYFHESSKNPHKSFNGLPPSVKDAETYETYLKKSTYKYGQ